MKAAHETTWGASLISGESAMKCGPDECPIMAFSDLTPAEQRVQRKRIVKKMKAQGFSQEKIAKQLGVSQQTVSSDLATLPATGKTRKHKQKQRVNEEDSRWVRSNPNLPNAGCNYDPTLPLTPGESPKAIRRRSMLYICEEAAELTQHRSFRLAAASEIDGKIIEAVHAAATAWLKLATTLKNNRRTSNVVNFKKA